MTTTLIMPVPEQEQREDLTSRSSCNNDPNTVNASHVIGPKDIRKLGPCPCCNKQLHAARHQVVGETPTTRARGGPKESLFSLFSDDDDELNDDLDESLDRMMPGVLAKGCAFTVKEIIAQGYVSKKGSGYDWLGSRAWKARWAVLVRARVDGHDVDVPLLQIFWTSTSPTASTVISLDSAVVIPENDLSKSNFHKYRFKIRHVKKSVNPESSVQLTRVFSCPKEGRDEWVYAINHALLEYEKEKANARRLSGLLTLSPPRRHFALPCTSDEAPQDSNRRQKRLQHAPPVPLSS